MDNKEFDDIIKKKLEALNSRDTDDGWEVFRQKWKNDNSSADPSPENSEETIDESLDDHFDAKIKQNMKGLRVPFNSDHWIKLKTQLESEVLFKKRLFVAKTVEILMLIFVIFGVLNILPIQNDIYELPVTDIPMVMAVPANKSTSEIQHFQSENHSKQQTKTINTANNKIPETPITPTKKNQQEKSKTSKIEPINSPHIESMRQMKIEDNFPFLNDYNENIELEASNIENEVTAINNKSITALLIPQRPLGYPDITLGSVRSKSEEKSYVSLAIGPKLNLINSPFDPVYEIDPYNTLNTNFNITAKIHKEVGPAELYAGLGYSKTSYEPLVVEEIYKNQNEQINQASLENISFNTFNVPIGVNYAFVNKPRLQLYAAAGVDVNLITQTDYEVYDLPAERGSRSPSEVKPETEKTEINQRALLSQKEFNLGILQGGSLKDNLYASASVSLGLIKNVSESMSLFIEPKYSHLISSKGLGPNLDRVHSVSLDFGVRYQLN